MKTVQEAVGNGAEQKLSLLFLLNPSSDGKENAKAGMQKLVFFSPQLPHASFHDFFPQIEKFMRKNRKTCTGEIVVNKRNFLLIK